MNDPHPKRLNAREIIDGYSAESPVGSINRAHRNARTLKWLEGQPAEYQLSLRMAYAREMGFPFDEVIWLPEPMDDEALTWVYNRCANWINHP